MFLEWKGVKDPSVYFSSLSLSPINVSAALNGFHCGELVKISSHWFGIHQGSRFMLSPLQGNKDLGHSVLSPTFYSPIKYSTIPRCNPQQISLKLAFILNPCHDNQGLCAPTLCKVHCWWYGPLFTGCDFIRNCWLTFVFFLFLSWWIEFMLLQWSCGVALTYNTARNSTVVFMFNASCYLRRKKVEKTKAFLERCASTPWTLCCTACIMLDCCSVLFLLGNWGLLPPQQDNFLSICVSQRWKSWQL